MRALKDNEFEHIQACVGANQSIQEMKRDGIASLDIAQKKTRDLLSRMDSVFKRVFTEEARALVSGVLSHVLTRHELNTIKDVVYEDDSIRVKH
jgi:hypothetical protein